MKAVVVSAVWLDLAGIADTIGNDNPDAALRFVEAVRKAFDLIGNQPGVERIRSFSQPGIRSWPITDFPNYLIFYLPRRSDVKILAVVHGARELKCIVESRL
jgi:toxin ParE1/3/4